MLEGGSQIRFQEQPQMSVSTTVPQSSTAQTGSGEDFSSKPRVCVALLNWNGWRDTVECLTSLQKLDYEECELLVIDNASTNDSVLRIRERFAPIKIIQLEKNLGFAGGCNVGIRYAISHGAQYAWLLNNDTKVDPSALRALVEVAEADGCVGAVGSIIYDMQHPRRIQAWGGGRVS